MTFNALFQLIQEFNYREETPNVEIKDLIIKGKVQDGKAFRIQFSNGAETLGMIRKWFNPETFEEKDYAINITRWNATPTSAMATAKNWQDEIDKHKNKGFASKSFNEVLKLAKQFNIKVFTIFAPTHDSTVVINNYINKKILIPIESSKAAYGDFYTEFYINWPEANKRLGN